MKFLPGEKTWEISFKSWRTPATKFSWSFVSNNHVARRSELGARNIESRKEKMRRGERERGKTCVRSREGEKPLSATPSNLAQVRGHTVQEERVTSVV